jgi:pentatricopeptide repeat protein
MPQGLPDVWSYNAVIRACEAAGRWREAVALLEELRTTAATATATSRSNSKGSRVAAVAVAPDTVTYNLVMSALAKAGRFDQALALLRQLQTATPVTANTANTANSVTNKSAAVASVTSAVAVAADAVSYGIMCSACCAAGRWKEGLNLLDQAWESGIELG